MNGYALNGSGIAVPESLLPPMPPAFGDPESHADRGIEIDAQYVPGMLLNATSTGMTRRQFLAGLGAGAALATASSLLPVPAMASGFWEQPRKLSMYRQETGERIKDVVYWKNGKVNPVGYAQVCRILRDVKANQTVQMSPRLLDLLCAIQAWVAQYGYTDMQINSGFRSAKTNASLENAARNSMHMYSCAADIVLPGLSTAYVGKLAQRYAGGGVGFYPDRGFIHVDTGRVRTWRG